MPLSRFIPEQEFLTGPGRHPDGRPFHPLGLALSFFVMWSITNMGQPGLMVRLMAFRDSRSLNRATLIVTIYHALVYLPLVTSVRFDVVDSKELKAHLTVTV